MSGEGAPPIEHGSFAAGSTTGSIPPPGAALSSSAVQSAPVRVIQPIPAAGSRQVDRRLATWIPVGVLAVAAVVAVALIALGGGSSAQQQIAQAINLHASDLPGFSVAPGSHTDTGRQIDSRLQKCTGPASTQHPGAVDVSSPAFTSGSGFQAEQIGSDVTIQRSSSLVASDLALMRSGQIRTCISQAFAGVSSPTSSGVTVTVSRVTVTQLSEPISGTDGSFGLRATIWMSALGRTVPVIMDVNGYAVGRDELGLDTLGIGQPVPLSTEHQLSELLVARALAHPH